MLVVLSFPSLNMQQGNQQALEAFVELEIVLQHLL
jgi:hypothetical protein